MLPGAVFSLKLLKSVKSLPDLKCLNILKISQTACQSRTLCSTSLKSSILHHQQNICSISNQKFNSSPRGMRTTSVYFNTETDKESANTNAEPEIEREGSPAEEESKEVDVKVPPAEVGKLRGSEKDRTKEIDVETSMRYLKSDAYKETYGDNMVWVLYRRNFRGQFAPKKTRKQCIRKGQLATGNPCPICRDEYLVLDYRNVGLLKQFISPFNGDTLSFAKTGLCQQKHQKLLVEVLKAKEHGTITYDIHHREYDYSEYEHLYKSYKEAV